MCSCIGFCRQDFTRAMVGKSTQGSLLDVQQRINQRLMKRNNSSAEDMMRSMMKPHLDRASLENGTAMAPSWRIADRCLEGVLDGSTPHMPLPPEESQISILTNAGFFA